MNPTDDEPLLDARIWSVPIQKPGVRNCAHKPARKWETRAVVSLIGLLWITIALVAAGHAITNSEDPLILLRLIAEMIKGIF